MSREPRGKAQRDELLDHEADGIREFDNALPRWWLYGFYFTILFAAAYLVNYHVLPRPLVGQAGMVAEYQAELAAAPRVAAAPAGAAAAALVAFKDPDNLARGKAIFEGPENACFSCHRQDLGGLVGPDLTDDHWLHGCTVADLVHDIKVGFPLKGMMPYGVGKTLTDEQVLQLASYVLSKRGSAPAAAKPIDPERDKVCSPVAGAS
jgi:cytochrome c oxidase cbb3-type subunit 3